MSAAGSARDARVARIGAALLELAGPSGLTLPPEAAERLADLAALVAEWAPRINLTGQRSADAVVDGLIFDAISLAPCLPRFETAVDIGSGAGFPGLPLAILFPGRCFTLLEAREKRHHFQRHAIRVLSLQNARALRTRAGEGQAELHDLAIAQAVASGPEALALATPWVRPGGHVAIPTSDPPPERDAPLRGAAALVRFHVAGTGRARALWLARVAPATATGGLW